MRLSIACRGTSNTGNTSNDGAAIGLGIFVAILMILLAVSLAVHIYCFLKYEKQLCFER